MASVPIKNGNGSSPIPGLKLETLLEHVLHYAGVEVPAPISERTRKLQVWRVRADWHKGFDQPITYGDLARRWAPHSEAYLTSIELFARTFQSRYCGGQPLLMVNQERRTPLKN